MKLSDRLALIASQIPKCNVVADIGTDHGYLPIALVKSGQCKKAYAMDVNKGPLEKAAVNIDRAKVTGKVQTILSDGLVHLPADTEVVVIAGMGGMLVERILKDSRDKLKSLSAMILSPHLDEPAVRRAVHRLNFCISYETMVVDQDKFYTVMQCSPGQESYSELEYKYGKVLMATRTDVWKGYISKELTKLLKIKERLLSKPTSASVARLKEVEKEIIEIREVLGDA